MNKQTYTLYQQRNTVSQPRYTVNQPNYTVNQQRYTEYQQRYTVNTHIDWFSKDILKINKKILVDCEDIL